MYVIIIDIISISSHVGSASYIPAVLLNTYFHSGSLDVYHLYPTCLMLQTSKVELLIGLVAT